MSRYLLPSDGSSIQVGGEGSSPNTGTTQETPALDATIEGFLHDYHGVRTTCNKTWEEFDIALSKLPKPEDGPSSLQTLNEVNNLRSEMLERDRVPYGLPITPHERDFSGVLSKVNTMLSTLSACKTNTYRSRDIDRETRQKLCAQLSKAIEPAKALYSQYSDYDDYAQEYKTLLDSSITVSVAEAER